MIGRFFHWLFDGPNNQAEQPQKEQSFSTHREFDFPRCLTSREARELREAEMPSLQLPKLKPLPNASGEVATMDDSDGSESLKTASYGAFPGIPEAQWLWFAAQNFIGYQLCAVLSQHWLIEKACAMPAKDAVRKGYDISVNDGTKVSPEIMDAIRDYDDAFRVVEHMIEWLRMGRIFGIRVALFVVDNPDPDYYQNPFNIDGVTPYSYKGISQIDPYWMVPELTSANALEPGNLDFYEPEFWRVGGRLIHKSHLVIFTTGAVPDVLKPAYYFGGVSVCQRIYERVYAAERTANEAPMLAMTKRTTLLYTDLTQAMADQTAFDDRLAWWASVRDNYGVKVNSNEDKLEQFDISLTDLDAVIMTQYQLVAAIAGVPGTKLLGTQPKGFNSTGEFEESSYHEELETFQNNDLKRLLRRHHSLIVKSRIVPKFGIKYFSVTAAWNPLDALTAKEQAEVNLAKSQNDAVLAGEGAIEAQDIRDRIVKDPQSGYSGIAAKVPPMPDALPPGAGMPPGAGASGDPAQAGSGPGPQTPDEQKLTKPAAANIPASPGA